MAYILANTKECPGCGKRTERIDGCNHMVCQLPNCKHHYCWMCLGPWKEHGTDTGGYYKCNKFNSDPDAQKKLQM